MPNSYNMTNMNIKKTKTAVNLKFFSVASNDIMAKKLQNIWLVPQQSPLGYIIF